MEIEKISKKERLAGIIDRVGAFRCLLILFLLFIITQTLINGYCKHIETYSDEWIYYGLAESLAKGMGFPAIYGEQFTSYTRYLYSILISPGLAVSNSLWQFRLIAMLNALYIGSGIFPVYLLAKRVLSNNWYAFFAGAIYLFLPDMEFTATFMTENIWLPVSLWVVFFFFYLVSVEDQPLRKKAVTGVLLLGSAAVLVYIKDSGISIVIALTAYAVFFIIFRSIRSMISADRKHSGIAKGVFLIVIVLFLCMAIFFSKKIFDQVSARFLALNYYLQQDLKRYLWCYSFTWATEILAIGVFPFAISLISYRYLNKSAKHLFGITLVLAFVANFAVASTSLGTTDVFGVPDFRLHQRYVIYLWILFFIVFLYVLKEKMQISAIKAGLTVFVTAAFCFVFRGAVIGSAVDMSMLYWAWNWMGNRWLWTAAVVLFVCLGFVLLHRKKAFCVYFFGIMAVVFLYDHYTAHGLIRTSYAFDYSGIKEVEGFIRENEDSTFLLVQLPSTDQVGDVHLNSKIADTLLVNPNTIFASGRKVTGVETDQGIDLASVGMDDLGISIVGAYDLDSVDYIVLTTEMDIDETGCEKVLENGYFNIYRLNDKIKLPYMGIVNTWNVPGKVWFQPEAGFFSHYYEGDTMTYVSGENPDYVLYGPYVSLSPASYEITIHYSCPEGASGEIGFIDLNGATINPEDHKTEVYADQDYVSISFDLEERCNNFEIRMFTGIPGVEVNAVEVNTVPTQTIETPDYTLLQYFGANNVLSREEYYSPDGGKMMNSSGFHAVDYDYLYGNRIKSSYYDIEDQPTNIAYGYSIVRYSYNPLRQVVREDYYDRDDEPVKCSGGYGAVEYDRDSNGYPIETRYYDVDGERLELSTGQAMTRRAYNERYLAIRDEFYDKAYEPVLCTDGYYAVEYEYDENDNISEFRYYDTENELIAINSGFAIKRCTYDEARQVIREEYYDEKEKPVICSGGYSAIEYDRDANGDVIETRYFGEEGERLEMSAGQAMTRRFYNENRQPIRDEYYDKAYEPVILTDGYYAVEYKYDDAGNIVEYRYYDTEDGLAMTTSGYAVLRREYNEAKKIIRQAYFDENDEPIAVNGCYVVEYVRDEEGHAVEEWYYGPDHELADNSSGYAHIVRTYDENGELVEEKMYHADGTEVEES